MRLLDLIISITARLAKVFNNQGKFPSFKSERVEVVFKTFPSSNSRNVEVVASSSWLF